MTRPLSPAEKKAKAYAQREKRALAKAAAKAAKAAAKAAAKPALPTRRNSLLTTSQAPDPRSRLAQLLHLAQSNNKPRQTLRSRAAAARDAMLTRLFANPKRESKRAADRIGAFNPPVVVPLTPKGNIGGRI